jgi:hypothetical protein
MQSAQVVTLSPIPLCAQTEPVAPLAHIETAQEFVARITPSEKTQFDAAVKHVEQRPRLAGDGQRDVLQQAVELAITRLAGDELGSIGLPHGVQDWFACICLGKEAIQESDDVRGIERVRCHMRTFSQTGLNRSADEMCVG